MKFDYGIIYFDVSIYLGGDSFFNLAQVALTNLEKDFFIVNVYYLVIKGFSG